MSDPGPASAPVSAGDVIEIPEGDYHPGRGMLRMRVTHVPHHAEVDPHHAGVDPHRAGVDLPHRADVGLGDQTWIQVLGVEINHDGSDGQHRIVIVRVAALRADPR